MTDPQVLIVGAGPTGLVLALWLARRGVAVRIVDKVGEPGTTSRALVVHARTLEFYHQLGVAEDVVAQGLPFDSVNLWSYGRHVARAELGAIGTGVTPFPHLVIYPQDRHERLLIEHLARAGVQVERNVELVGFTDRGDAVDTRLRHADGTERSCTVRYLAGCDGAHSIVRETLGIGFPGGTYDRIFYVADVVARGPITNHELHVALDDADLFAAFPLKGVGNVRLIGTVLRTAEARHEQLTWDDVSRLPVDRMGVVAEKINWFSTYHVHHRVANRFRSGSAFLAGDSAHIHSPVGGQGMNTGIGDAVNLGWKLVEALKHPGTAAVLDSYEPERIAFAQRLVATTDRAFTFITRNGALARLIRRRIFPLVVPPLAAMQPVRRFMFRTLSQTAINYRGSGLSSGRAGSVHGGDRLPWVPPEAGTTSDNYTPLTSMEWQVHVYGTASPDLSAECGRRGLALSAFRWRKEMATAGLVQNAIYFVRPDGHVALAGTDAAGIARYLDQELSS